MGGFEEKRRRDIYKPAKQILPGTNNALDSLGTSHAVGNWILIYSWWPQRYKIIQYTEKAERVWFELAGSKITGAQINCQGIFFAH